MNEMAASVSALPAQRHTRITGMRRVWCAVGVAVRILLACALLANAFWLLTRYLRAVPDALEVYSPYGVGISVEQQSFGLAAEEAALLENRPVRAVVANAAYGTAAKIPMISGGWFLQDAAQKQRRYAVLPDTLARALFGSAAISGSTVTLRVGKDEAIYEICGVYAVSARLLDAVGRTQTEKIYLSCPVTPVAEGVPAQQLLVQGDGSSQGLLRNVSDESRRMLHGTEHDLRAPRDLAGQIFYLTIVLCLCLPLGMLLAYGGRGLVQLYSISQGQMYTMAKDAHVWRMRDYLLLAAKSIVCIAAVCTALWLLLRNISIPGLYLPMDNVFDLAHYQQTIVGFFQTRNSGGRADEYGWLTSAYLLAITASSVGGAAFWYAGVGALKKMSIS